MTIKPKLEVEETPPRWHELPKSNNDKSECKPEKGLIATINSMGERHASFAELRLEANRSVEHLRSTDGQWQQNCADYSAKATQSLAALDQARAKIRETTLSFTPVQSSHLSSPLAKQSVLERMASAISDKAASTFAFPSYNRESTIAYFNSDRVFNQILMSISPAGNVSKAATGITGFQKYAAAERKVIGISKNRIAIHNYVKNQQYEEIIANNLDKSIPLHLPAGFPTHLNIFNHQCEAYSFKLTKLGADQSGKMEGHLLYKTVGKDAMFVIQKSWNSLRNPNISNRVIIRSTGLYSEERMAALLKEIYKVSNEKGFNRVFLAWNPKFMPVATVLESQSQKILSTGSFSAGLRAKPFTLVEIAPNGLK